MTYQPGAVLCNLFLADELNRATSRTQSALLEAMEEGQVTVDGQTHPIPQPFTVIATQNPVGAAGTQLLPGQPDGPVYHPAVHGLSRAKGRAGYDFAPAGGQSAATDPPRAHPGAAGRASGPGSRGVHPDGAGGLCGCA